MALMDGGRLRSSPPLPTYQRDAILGIAAPHCGAGAALPSSHGADKEVGYKSDPVIRK